MLMVSQSLEGKDHVSLAVIAQVSIRTLCRRDQTQRDPEEREAGDEGRVLPLLCGHRLWRGLRLPGTYCYGEQRDGPEDLRQSRCRRAATGISCKNLFSTFLKKKKSRSLWGYFNILPYFVICRHFTTRFHLLCWGRSTSISQRMLWQTSPRASSISTSAARSW